MVMTLEHHQFSTKPQCQLNEMHAPDAEKFSCSRTKGDVSSRKVVHGRL